MAKTRIGLVGQHTDCAAMSLDVAIQRLKDAYECVLEAKVGLDANKRLLGTMYDPLQTETARLRLNKRAA